MCVVEKGSRRVGGLETKRVVRAVVGVAVVVTVVQWWVRREVWSHRPVGRVMWVSMGV